MNKTSENSLAHTRWECKYHLVFAPKYRRQIIYLTDAVLYDLLRVGRGPAFYAVITLCLAYPCSRPQCDCCPSDLAHTGRTDDNPPERQTFREILP